jgi:ribosomal protein S12 methylthiotransferase
MVLVDEVDGSQAIGRTSADAPEIDGVVYLADAEGLQVGDLVEVEITDADGHDLWAAPPNRD